MKRLTFIFVTIILVSSLNAQRVGIKGGLAFANAQYELYKTAISTSSLTGGQIGLVTETPLSSDFYLSSGILYCQKGTKISLQGIVGEFPIEYIEIPLSLTYKYDLGTSKLFVQAGPYVGVGLSAKLKSGVNSQTIEFGSDVDQMKKIDFGFNFGGGIEIRKVQLGINYGLGMVNLSNDTDELMKNGVLSLSLAVFFRD
jgi:hypothetical protein